MYALTNGAEQVAFEKNGPCPRSETILRELSDCVRIPEQGRLLDVGCGNGALLTSFRKLHPKWDLMGTEQHDRFRREVERIPGVKGFHHGPLEGLDHEFDLITLVYVLEHVTNPRQFLEELRRKLAPSGILLIQVPDLTKNLFDLMVVDHCSHFVIAALVRLTQSMGFRTLAISTDWVYKEISLVLVDSRDSQPDSSFQDMPIEYRRTVLHALSWLEKIVEHARKIASKGKFGIFGTAIAGTWLAGMLGSAVNFFVDEDPARRGRRHLGLEVLPPAEVPEGTYVYLALPFEIAEHAHKRLRSTFPSVDFVSPPPPM